MSCDVFLISSFLFCCKWKYILLVKVWVKNLLKTLHSTSNLCSIFMYLCKRPMRSLTSPASGPVRFCSPHKIVWFHPAVIFASKAMMSSIDQVIKHDAKAMLGTHKCLLWLKPPYFYLTSSAISRYPWQWDCAWKTDGIQSIKYADVQWFGPKDSPFYCHPLSKVILV